MFEPTHGGHFGRKTSIEREAGLADKRVAGMRCVGIRKAGHDHPRVEPTGERNAHAFGMFGVAREDSLKCLAKLGFVLLFGQWFLRLPLAGSKITRFALQTVRSEAPAGASWEEINAAEQRSFAARATIGEILRDARLVKRPKLGKNGKQRFPLTREIHFAIRLMNVKALDAVATVEQHGG